ncbi:GNAT family N-acetyltransferase [Seongchinamella sediminis]|uniref:GNAT family N-acetyltransferase n=1 Tax=Seongchinamella sediminis TaxID=2283635 RepID=A0A3L7E082_9GAMM|nr:GNAT family N-acetyltransferase [Seongchinamella sediminis]RLQ22325.1 GNAT family N-acetyltransferase [Seongchinamella sediminis]
MQVPEIVDAGSGQQGTLADILADAFREDPVMNWVIPAPQLYPGFFRLLAADLFLPRGVAHLDSDERAAALWLPPGVGFDVRPSLSLLGLVVQLLLRRGPKPLLRIPQQDRLFARHTPAEPHYHLVFVGCRKSAQGQGLGSAMLKQGTRICDEQTMPAYLESSNALNIPLYQRHGFEIIAEETFTGGGPRVWFMWREAR